MSHFDCHINRRFRHSKKVVQVVQMGERGGGLIWTKSKRTATFFLVKPSLSLDRSDHTALVVNDDILLIGGASYKKPFCVHSVSGCPLANGEFLKSRPPHLLCLIFLLPGKKQFALRHGSHESCALVVNNSEVLVIGGVSKPRRNLGDTTSNQTWSILPISSDVDGIHGKVHR